jgi:flagellar assembly factor FliW
MLLNNCGDGNRKSPATGHFAPERKESFVCDFTEREFFFPAGVLGFGNCRRYRLDRFCPADGSESPFFILRSVDQSPEFPLIHPSSLSLDYRFHTSPEVLAALEATSPDRLVPMLIVTVRDRLEEITVNLQGPLVLNPNSFKGLQLVVEDYPLRHPLIGPTSP